MGEAVSDGDAFESGDGAVVVLGFSEDFLSDGRGILACIALSENDYLMAGLELELIETACTIFKEFFQGNIKVIGDTSHIGTIDILESLISISQASTNRLIDKDHVVVFGPAVIISDDIIGLHVGSDESVGSTFEEVTELAGGTGAAVEPEDDGVVGDL